MIKEIGTVAVMVSDRQKALDWYTQKLGFEVKANTEHWVVVGLHGQSFGLHLCATEFPGSKLEPGNTGILFNVDNLETTVAELKGKDVVFAQDITKEFWGTYAMCKDPDGNEFWLMAH